MLVFQPILTKVVSTCYFIKRLSKPDLGWIPVLLVKSIFDCGKDLLVVLKRKVLILRKEKKYCKNHHCIIHIENNAGQLPQPAGPSKTDPSAASLPSAAVLLQNLLQHPKGNILQTNLSYISNNHMFIIKWLIYKEADTCNDSNRRYWLWGLCRLDCMSETRAQPKK